MCLGKQTVLSPEHRKWRLMTSFTFPQLCPVCEGCGKVCGDSASRSAQASPSPPPSPDFVFREHVTPYQDSALPAFHSEA